MTMFEFIPLEKTIFIESHYSAEQKMLPFVQTDLLIHYVNETQKPLVHFWTMDHTLVLGMKDTRLPYWSEALTFLKETHTPFVIRNSGGLAVLLDRQVLNISLILPLDSMNPLSVTAAYDQMYHWIRSTFEEKGQSETVMTAGEIVNSYCPGTFDISIHNKKFAGTAQRRIKQAAAVMMYISIDGNQDERAQLVQKFYQAGLKEQFGENEFPAVTPHVMANLSDLLQQTLTVPQAQKKLQTSFRQLFQSQVKLQEIETLFSPEKYDELTKIQFIRMKKRNEGN